MYCRQWFNLLSCLILVISFAPSYSWQSDLYTGFATSYEELVQFFRSGTVNMIHLMVSLEIGISATATEGLYLNDREVAIRGYYFGTTISSNGCKRAFYVADSGVLVLDGITVSNMGRCGTDDCNGGAIYLAYGGVFAGYLANFVDCTACGSGGAIYGEEYTLIELRADSTFTRNKANVSGGAIYLKDYSRTWEETVCLLTDTHFSGNSAAAGEWQAVRSFGYNDIGCSVRVASDFEDGDVSVDGSHNCGGCIEGYEEIGERCFAVTTTTLTSVTATKTTETSTLTVTVTTLTMTSTTTATSTSHTSTTTSKTASSTTISETSTTSLTTTSYTTTITNIATTTTSRSTAIPTSTATTTTDSTTASSATISTSKISTGAPSSTLAATSTFALASTSLLAAFATTAAPIVARSLSTTQEAWARSRTTSSNARMDWTTNEWVAKAATTSTEAASMHDDAGTTLSKALTSTIEGSFKLTVDDAEAFVDDSEVKAGVKTAIAEMANVDPSQVSVNLVMENDRLRRLADSPTIRVEFSIVLSGSNDQVTSATDTVLSNLKKATPSEASTIVSAALSSLDYSVEVTELAEPTSVIEEASTGEAIGETTSNVFTMSTTATLTATADSTTGAMQKTTTVGITQQSQSSVIIYSEDASSPIVIVAIGAGVGMAAACVAVAVAAVCFRCLSRKDRPDDSSLMEEHAPPLPPRGPEDAIFEGDPTRNTAGAASSDPERTEESPPVNTGSTSGSFTEGVAVVFSIVHYFVGRKCSRKRRRKGAESTTAAEHTPDPARGTEGDAMFGKDLEMNMVPMMTFEDTSSAPSVPSGTLLASPGGTRTADHVRGVPSNTVAASGPHGRIRAIVALDTVGEGSLSPGRRDSGGRGRVFASL